MKIDDEVLDDLDIDSILTTDRQAPDDQDLVGLIQPRVKMYFTLTYSC